jgi:hypothetical protein
MQKNYAMDYYLNSRHFDFFTDFVQILSINNEENNHQ